MGSKTRHLHSCHPIAGGGGEGSVNLGCHGGWNYGCVDCVWNLVSCYGVQAVLPSVTVLGIVGIGIPSCFIIVIGGGEK